MPFISVDKRGRGTLPEEVRRGLGVGEEGALVLIEKTERGTYELIPAALVPRDQLWFHHPEMERRVREAEAELGEGTGRVAGSPEEAQAVLDSLKKG
jgi:bifunctional DNA-binding transcriptional regulator/antitoxin component of YhaV-PrlF toxin-antitoxin module